MNNYFEISANLVDIEQQAIYPARIIVQDGKIASIQRLNEQQDKYILPGFTDAHVHIESSMLTPAEFARLAVVHGTVATVSDPHEIGNVMGIEGVQYMIENGKSVPFKFNFGAPSCVPATTFETAGAEITADDIDKLMQQDDIKYLAEMMNWPGVLHHDTDVYKKIAIAQKYNKPVDGHAPGLKGEQAKQYIAAGISTDHECFTAEEAVDKLKYGMKILIREGSAAKNFEALAPLLHEHSDNMMFCSDDKHPDSLELGYINELVKRALAKGVDLYKVLKAACINPVKHYKLDVGLLKEGDAADFIVVSDLKEFKILKTYIDGQVVAENGETRIEKVANKVINNFNTSPKKPEDFKIRNSSPTIRVIEPLDGQLITNERLFEHKQTTPYLVSDPNNDVLKITVVNRYADAPPAVGFISNFGLKRGAIASSVAHDSHNIIAIGADDESLCRAVNLIIKEKGGISLTDNQTDNILPLPIAGIMTSEDGYKVAKQYAVIDSRAKNLGSGLASPYMTLSFMALLVIPFLKLSDRGLFDGSGFRFVNPLV
jgi:adenine deaminase